MNKAIQTSTADTGAGSGRAPNRDGDTSPHTPALIVAPAVDAQHRADDTLGETAAKTLQARTLARLATYADGYAIPVVVTRNERNEFTIRVRDGDDLPSDRPNENSNEGKLTALVFHTAILKQITEHGDTFPLRLFIVDSPYSESPDTRNTPDITNFLQQLPEILPEYQLILGIADTNMADREAFVNQYNIVDF